MPPKRSVRIQQRQRLATAPRGVRPARQLAHAQAIARGARGQQVRVPAAPRRGRAPPVEEYAMDEEVNQNESGGENQEEELNDLELPLPPAHSLVEVMANQTRLLEALAQGINRPRYRGPGLQGKMSEFIRIKPPTFGGSSNPLEADD